MLVYIGLGSNVGDRAAHLRKALRALEALPDVAVRRVSSVFETEAHTLDASERQPPYLNAVAEVAAACSPEALLAGCLRIEQAEGRDRSRGRWAPRTLDLDLLVADGLVRRTAALTLPHPRLGGRRFVLQPLAELAPELYVPAPYDATVARLLADCPDPDVPRRTEVDLGPAAS